MMSDQHDAMQCVVYKSLVHEGSFVFLAQSTDLDELPNELRARMGRLEKVMDLELYPGRKLARARAEDIMQAIDDKGFYLQVPPPKEVLMGNDLLPR